jgi:hypothetical protein
VEFFSFKPYGMRANATIQLRSLARTTKP